MEAQHWLHTNIQFKENLEAKASRAFPVSWEHDNGTMGTVISSEFLVLEHFPPPFSRIPSSQSHITEYQD